MLGTLRKYATYFDYMILLQSPVNRPLDEVTIAVRRELAPVIRDLFEHGMVRVSLPQMHRGRILTIDFLTIFHLILLQSELGVE